MKIIVVAIEKKNQEKKNQGGVEEVKREIKGK
jgi:hypothetical protein